MKHDYVFAPDHSFVLDRLENNWYKLSEDDEVIAAKLGLYTTSHLSDCQCADKNECVHTVNMNIPYYRSEDWSMFGYTRPNPLSLGITAREFYGTLMLANQSNKVSYAGIIDNISQQLLAAIQLACAGEFRYSARKGLAGFWAQFIRNNGQIKGPLSTVRGPTSMGRKTVGRRTGYLDYIDRIENDERVVEDRGPSASALSELISNPYGTSVGLRVMRNAFLWHGKYLEQTVTVDAGGVLWASAAQLGYDYSRRKIGDIEFIDRAFDLQHNGANLFTKTHTVPTYFPYWLDARSEASPEWLVRWAPNHIRERMGYKPVTPLLMRWELCHEDAKLPADDKASTPEEIVENGKWLVKAIANRRTERAQAGRQALVKMVRGTYDDN